jgi:hypothetical protein
MLQTKNTLLLIAFICIYSRRGLKSTKFLLSQLFDSASTYFLLYLMKVAVGLRLQYGTRQRRVKYHRIEESINSMGLSE